MLTNQFRLVTVLAALGLSACGGPAVSPPLPGLGTKVLGNANVSGSVPASGAPAGFSDGAGNPIAAPARDTALDHLRFDAAATSAADNTFDIIAYTDNSSTGSSGVTATTIGVSSNVGGTGASTFGQVARYTRFGTSLLPTSGTGTYSGQYVGTLGSPTGTINGGSGLVAINGSYILNADFGAKTIGGSIKNRVEVLKTGPVPGETFANVTLPTTSILSDGTFAASGVTGGGLDSATDTTSNGSYQGLIGGVNPGNGQNGFRAAGTMSLTHTIGANTYTELGVFSGHR